MKIKNLLTTVFAIIGFAIISTAQTLPNNVSTNGLIGYWSFDGNANDSSGNNLDGNIIGSTELTDDRFGQTNSAYDFDYANASFGQQNDEIYIPYDNILNVDNITVSVWVYPRQYFWSGNTGTSNTVVLTRWENGTSNPSGTAWRLGYDSSSVKVHVSDGSSSTVAQDNTPLTLNTWNHIVMTYNSQNVKLYINGVLKATTSNPVIMNTVSTSGISIGEAAQYNGYWHHTDGKIDDIGIWDRALTDQEVNNLYNNNETVCLPEYVPNNGLVGFWGFCNNADDSSDNNLDGNVIGSTELTNDRFGQTNSAYDFDYANASFGQQNDEIYIPYDNILNVDNITVSVWVYPRQYFWSGNTGTSNTVVLTRWENGTSNPSGTAWRLGYDSSSVKVHVSDGSSSTVAQDNTPLTLNTWNHIVMTYNSQNVKLYINGVLKATTSNPVIMNTVSTSGISIGEAAQYNGYWHHTDGKIDDIGIWDRALTDQEVNNLYNETLTTTELNKETVFEVYPNPVKNYLNLKVRSNLMGSKYNIYNSLGNVVNSGILNRELNIINIQSLSSGLYFLKIENLNATHKIIKN